MASGTGSVKGLTRVLQRLNSVVQNTEQGAIRGLLAGGMLIQRRSMARTPVEYGFLRASAFTRRAQGDENSVEIGYSAGYAKFVHDNTRMKLRGKKRPSGLGTYWNPGEAKFLSKAYAESVKDVIGLVIKYSKVR